MKFWTGVVVGATISGFVLASIDADERERLARRVKQAALSGRSGEIASSVSSGVGDIADIATARVTTTVEQAASKVADTLDTNEHAEPGGHTASSAASPATLR